MKEKPLTVYVDGGCPLCRREVALYKSIDRVGRIVWRDLAADPRAAEAIGVSCETALKRIHAEDAQEGVVTGARVFAEIWRRLPGLNHFGYVMTIPPLSWLAEGAYRVFVVIRPPISRALARRERRAA